MAEGTELTEREHQELTALYQATVSDLAFFKSQQWTITNYALLAFGAVIAVRYIPNFEPNSCGKAILCIVATVVYFLAGWLLWRLKTSIEVRRERLERIFIQFTQKFRVVRGEKKQVSATEVFVFLGLVLTFGIAIVWWVILCG